MDTKIVMQEFERLYQVYGRLPERTMDICAEIANKHGWNVDEVADYVYINRYEDIPADEEETEE
jgi:hypothetical protein